MAEFVEESGGLEAHTIGIYRTSATVKGGRRFSFGALVVVGDRAGSVGLGYAKAPGVPGAIEKAQKYAKRNMKPLILKESTIPHGVKGKFGASSVVLVPASPGTGVIAGGTVRAILEMAGVKDCLTKAYGSTNQKNLSKAVMQGLGLLRTKETVAALRGLDLGLSAVEQVLEAGRRYAPASTATVKRKPVEKKDDKRRDSRSGGRGGSGGGRGRGGDNRGPRNDKPVADKPAPDKGGEATGGEAPKA